MADTCSAAPYKVSAVTHNSASILSPMEFSYQETINFVEHRPAAWIAPCAAIQSYSLTATVRAAEFKTPIVRGTKGSLVATLKKMAGTTLTVTLANMQAGASSATQGDGIGSQSQEFHYDSGDTESFAPVTVA